jgi:integrase
MLSAVLAGSQVETASGLCHIFIIGPCALRSSAAYASRNGVPLEAVSKVILRHQDLKTTQVYLGKINDTGAIRWMDSLQGK